MGEKWEDKLNQRLEARERLLNQVKEEIKNLLDQAENLVYKAKNLRQAFRKKDSDIAGLFTSYIGGWIEIELKKSQTRDGKLISKITGRIIGVEQDGLERWRIVVMFQSRIVFFKLSQIKSIKIIGD